MVQIEIIAILFGCLTIAIPLAIVIPLAISGVRRKIDRVEEDLDRTQTKLAVGIARFDRLAANIPGVIYQYELYPDGTDRFTYISDRARDIYECEPAAIIKDSSILWRTIHPEDIARVRAIDLRAISPQEPFDLEFRIVTPSGQVKWIHTTSFTQSQNGNELTWDGIAIDITARKQAEAEAREGNAHLRLLYETTRDLLSTDRPLTLVGALFEKLKPMMGLDIYFNYLVDEDRQMLNLSFYGGISEDIAIDIKWLDIGSAVCGMVAKERRQIVQSDIQNSNVPHTVSIRSLGLQAYSCQPLVAQGKLFGTLGFGSRSRTSFTLAETQLFQALCDQIAIALDRSELVDSLQQQAEDLTLLNRLKDEFLAALSHELRTPLNPILGWTLMMRSRQLSPMRMSEALAIVERNTRQQIAIVDDLLDVSSAIRGKLHLNWQPVDLAQAIDGAIDTLKFAAAAKDVRIDRQGCTSLPLFGDRDRLQQICWNLLSNAIKFTPAGGHVAIDLTALSDGAAQIQVTDNGIGIDREFLPYVFEYFRQAEGGSKRAFGGLGLGLGLVRHLVELHGGTITAESEGNGCGATFTAIFPRRAATETPPAPSTARAQLSLPTKPHVLLIVKDPEDLELLGSVLQEDGSIVTAVTSPLDAIVLLQEHLPDVVVCDLNLPEMSGYELLSRIRALPDGDRLPVIALTPNDRYYDPTPHANRFDAYIAKPVDPLQLLSCLAQSILDRL